MIKSNILFFILILITGNLFGQNNRNYGVNIRTTASVSGGEYFIDIVVRQDSLKILYKMKDSTSSKFDDDLEVKELRQRFGEIQSIPPQKDTVSRILYRLDTLRQYYTSYSVDSISVSLEDVPSYLRLLETVIFTSTEALKNKSHNQDRMVLDGTRIKFDVIKAGLIRTVYAHSPSAESHPLLHSLIKNTINLYRERKNNHFLTIEKTNGY